MGETITLKSRSSERMTTCKPPSELGFSRGASFRVNADGKAIDLQIADSAKQDSGIVYVAWLKPLERALKVGFTGGTLWGRWAGIIRVINAVPEVHKLRPNEWQDQRKLVDPSLGQQVELWFKPAQRARIDYAAAEGFPDILLAEAEERFLDWYYCPLFGRPLGERRMAAV